MSDIDDILARELGKIGKMVGGSGASFGARFASKFLRTETYTKKMLLNLTPDKAFELGLLVLGELGTLQNEASGETSFPLLRAVIGSGSLNMNPALVCLVVLDGESESSELVIAAAAKEGLIKQGTAAKAVKRVVSAISHLNFDLGALKVL